MIKCPMTESPITTEGKVYVGYIATYLRTTPETIFLPASRCFHGSGFPQISSNEPPARVFFIS
jgi:hypothetical protein